MTLPVPQRGGLGYAIAAAVALTIFLVGYAGGGYSFESRAVLGIVAWWAIAAFVAVGLWPPAALPRAALAVTALLAALAAVTGLSVLWGDDAARELAEVDRVSMYLALYVLAVFALTRAHVADVADGIAAGIAALAVLALASRCFPGALDPSAIGELIPNAAARLSYPVGYWNGLGILTALAFPLLLRAAVTHAPPAAGVWLAPVPALGATIYLTSSRGAVVTAALGSGVFLALVDRRARAGGAAATGLVGALLAVAVLERRPELLHGPLDAEQVESQGATAAALILLICCVTGAAYALAARAGPRLPAVPRPARRAAVGAVLVLVLVAVVAADPGRRFDEFREPPTAAEQSEPGGIGSGGGSGRWQFWSAAADGFAEAPLLGHGAGSYAALWAQHRTIRLNARDAHSLYLETLAELGLLGFLPLLGVVAVGIVAAVGRTLRAAGQARATNAALAAVVVAFAAAAALDWIWELTVVGLVGIVALAAVTGRATAPGDTASRVRFPPLARVAVGLAGLLAIGLQTLPLGAELELDRSRSAAGRADFDEARAAASRARATTPWAAEPYLQLALVAEREGDAARARLEIARAIERAPRDWRLWAVASRVAAKAGDEPGAAAYARRARELNPLSDVAATVG